MSDQNTFYLGLDFLLAAVVLGIGVAGVNRFFPKVGEKRIKVIAGIVLGIFLMVKGLWGLPGPDVLMERLRHIVPQAAAALWIFLALRFWLGARTQRLVMEARIDLIGADLSAAKTDIESKYGSISTQAETDRTTLRGEVASILRNRIEKTESEFNKRFLRMETSIDSVGSRVDSHVTILTGSVDWLTRAVNLINLELGKIPVRSEESLKLLRGPERVVHRNGERTVRPPRFSNIEDLSEQLVELSRRVDAMARAGEEKGLSQELAGVTSAVKSLDREVEVLRSWAQTVVYGRIVSDEMVREPIGRDLMIARMQGQVPVELLPPKWQLWADGRIGLLEAVILSLDVDPRTFRPNGDPVLITDLSTLLPENQEKIKARFYKAKQKFGEADVSFSDFVKWAVEESLPITEDAKLIVVILEVAKTRPKLP